MSKGEFAIIGTGEVQCGRCPERSEFEIAYRVANLAIQDAGIDKDEIGAVIGAAHIMGSDYNTEMFFGRLPEAIGARNCKITASTISGGASSFSIRTTVEGILASGETDTVLVVHAQRFSQFSANELATYFAAAGSDPEWDVPYGMSTTHWRRWSPRPTSPPRRPQSRRSRRCALSYPSCEVCYGEEFSWVEAAGRATRFAFTVNHSAVPFPFVADLPYVTAIVELAEGVRMISNIVECDHDSLRNGMPLTVVFNDVSDECTLPQWKPVSE